MNKLWNNFLLESSRGNKYDKISVEITKKIIRRILSPETRKRLESKIDFFSTIESPIENVKFFIQYKFNDKTQIGGFFSPNDPQKGSYVRVNIFFKEDDFSYEKWFGSLTGNFIKDVNNNLIISQIYRVLRHEIEHIRQDKMNIDYGESLPKDNRTYQEEIDYFLKNNEVEAYIVQLAKTEKLKKPEERDWTQSLDNFFEHYSKIVQNKIFKEPSLSDIQKQKIYLDFIGKFQEKIQNVLIQRKWNL